MLILGNYYSDSSISFLVNSGMDGSVQWCEGLKILYLLNGSAKLSLEGRVLSLHKNDFAVINAFSPHTLLPDESAGSLSLQIPTKLIQQAFHTETLPRFHCCSANSPAEQQPWFERIRKLFASLFRAVYKEQQSNTPLLYRHLFELFDILNKYFRDDSVAGGLLIDGRFREILQDITTHAQDNLSVTDVAKRHFITTSTLSRMFQKNLGTTFTDYLNTIRLGNAFSDLLRSDLTITEIALQNGFKSANAFIKVFRRQYGVTPGRFRQTQMESSPENRELSDPPLFLTLLEYQDEPETLTESTELSYHISAARHGTQLRHSWKNLVNIGYAKEGLLSAVQKLLRRVQKEIGFRYIHFQGLLDDDMLVYTEDASGHPKLNFSLVDILFDFILSIDLLPYVEFSFMPALLAKHKERHFRRGVYMSVPNDMQKWLYVIQSFMEHFEERYGKRMVQQWHFCILNINSAVIGGHNDFEEYCALYIETYRLIKKMDSAYQIGGPGGYAGGTWQDTYIRRFLEICRENDCIPDQFSFLCYPYNTIEDTDIYRFMLDPQPIHPEALSADEDFVTHAMQHFRSMLTELDMPHERIILEAWNSTMWQRDLCSETCFKSAYLVKNIVENYDSAQGMGHWTLIDMMEEVEPTTELFHGGFGLCTFQGIPKPALGALQLLNKLGDYAVFADQGCYVTRSGSGVQIILYNYCHYHTLYRHHFHTSPQNNVYDNFVDKPPLHFTLHVTGLSAGSYSLRRYSIGRKKGSTFDAWQAMGAPSQLNDEEFSYLLHASDPDYQISYLQSDGALTLHAEVEPHEVQLLLLDVH